MSIHYTQLGHPALLCNHMEETLKFYTQTLGFRQVFSLEYEDGTPWLTYVQIARGQFVELFYKNYASENRAKERSFHHFCVEVDDMAAVLADLHAKGVPVFCGPVDNGVCRYRIRIISRDCAERFAHLSAIRKEMILNCSSLQKTACS